MIRSLMCMLCIACGIESVAQIQARTQGPADIPEELLRDCDAVVRLSSTELVYVSPSAATERRQERITILNRAAAHKGYFACMVDKTRRLKSFSGTVTDGQGRIIRKLKRSELKYTEISTNLADDSGYYLLEIHVPTIPYTVTYAYEIDYRDGILAFPTFMPLSDRETSLERGEYKLIVPKDLPVAYKCQHCGEPRKSTEEGRDVYSWALERVPAVRHEPDAPPLIDRIPLVLSVPHDFRFEGTQGSMRDWASFGMWQAGLLRDRNLLPEALRAEVHRRTDSLASPREKVRALYEYMGETTRYVSIQLGIGGLQPMSAEEVFRTKFGDCKALSNYLRAMLRECGIEADYTLIHSRRPRMHRDFASVNQADHVILRVPLPADTLWLECTNPDVPFGYIHTGIAGHDAVAITGGTGEFVTLPAYADTLNRILRHAEITVASDGSAKGHVTERFEAALFESAMAFAKTDARQKNDYLLKRLRIPTAKLDAIACSECKDALPGIEIEYGFSTPQYLNISGSRAFMPLFPFAKRGIFRGKERCCDIYRATGFLEIATVTIRLPENMRAEAMPPSGAYSAPTGDYSFQIDAQNGIVTARFRAVMHAGTYSRDESANYEKLLNAVATAFNANVVLKMD